MAYANITANRLDVQREGEKNVFEVASGVTIYDGSAVLLASGKATYAVAEGSMFAGVSAEKSKDGKVGVYATGVFRFKGSSLAGTDVGKVAYLSTGSSGDSATILTTAPATANSLVCPVGVIVGVPSATEADVRIDGYALKEAITKVSGG